MSLASGYLALCLGLKESSSPPGIYCPDHGTIGVRRRSRTLICLGSKPSAMSIRRCERVMVSKEGFEPPTNGLEGRRSVRLSYLDKNWGQE